MQTKISKLFVTTILLGSLTGPCFAEQGDWSVRVRAIGVLPNDDSSQIALGGANLADTGVSVDDAYVPEIDVTYMLSDHWGLELIAAIANHDVSIEGNGLAGLGINNGADVLDTWVLPPTLTLQYHFQPGQKIRPYVGFGVNYTAFLWSDAASSLEQTVGGGVDVDTDSSFGWALQAGVDIDWKNNWFFNLDVKYVDMNTDATLDVTGGALAGSRLTVDVDIDPFIVGAGIGYRF